MTPTHTYEASPGRHHCGRTHHRWQNPAQLSVGSMREGRRRQLGLRLLEGEADAELVLQEPQERHVTRPRTVVDEAERLLRRDTVRQMRQARLERRHPLAADPDPGVRADVAGNPAIDGTLIRALAGDDSHDVRRRLAHHPDIPLDVLTRLARGTRIGGALLPRIAAASGAEAEELACSPDPAVRMLVAQRRDLPPEIRDALATDADAKVVKSVAPHPGLSEAQLRAMVGRHGVRVLAKVATNPDATPALLEELARHEPPVPKALREVARHRNVTASALLACLGAEQVRPLAAGHPALPPQTIADLLTGTGTDTDLRVAEQAAANPSLPHAVMRALLAPPPPAV